MINNKYSSFFTEDIDIVNDGTSDTPPHYHDVMETDRSNQSASTSGATMATGSQSEKSKSKLVQKMENQVKSIMKKTSLKEERKGSSSRKDESKRRSGNFSETNSPKSPKHSTSAYSDIADPMHVQVAVNSAAGTRGSVVDKIDMSSLPSQNSIPSYASSTRSSHKQSPSYEGNPDSISGVAPGDSQRGDIPDDGGNPGDTAEYLRTESIGLIEDDSAKVKLDLLESHNGLETLKSNGISLDDSHNSSSGSLNTAL